ncbi:MAG TPA: hypothetical protein VEJ38_09070 [Candidatus Acidoferrales bacterium]|nr:hypothetical protein [Candidatus Acidoferrales bacterium]
MQIPCTRGAAVSVGFLSAVLLSSLAACSNYCVNFQSNPGGTINTSTTCGTSTTTGNVILTFGTSSTSGATSASTTAPVRSPQIFATLRGVDALPISTPGDDAPAWQPLAPQLADRPVQVDLNARVGDYCATNQLGTATVPAGVYSRLRLRVVPNQESDRLTIAASPLDESACGTRMFNCVIPSGIGRPLAWDVPAEIEIPSDRIDGGSIAVLSNSTTRLAISPATGSSVLAFSASVQRSCPPAE